VKGREEKPSVCSLIALIRQRAEFQFRLNKEGATQLGGGEEEKEQGKGASWK